MLQLAAANIWKNFSLKELKDSPGMSKNKQVYQRISVTNDTDDYHGLFSGLFLPVRFATVKVKEAASSSQEIKA